MIIHLEGIDTFPAIAEFTRFKFREVIRDAQSNWPSYERAKVNAEEHNALQNFNAALVTRHACYMFILRPYLQSRTRNVKVQELRHSQMLHA